MQQKLRAIRLSSARRLVVKVGSALITDAETGKINDYWLDTLIEDVASFLARGQQVIIVTSGAAAAGSGRLKHSDRISQTEERRAAAAIGQVQLMGAYERSLKQRGFGVGQLLLSSEDLGNGCGDLAAKATLTQLIKAGFVPVVNTNDATANQDALDNDQLAARIAEMITADILVLLSNIEGLFTEDPRNSPSANLVSEVQCITPQIEAMAAGSSARYSSGGMVTKLMAAKIATKAGCGMLIAKGNDPHPLSAIESGAPSTYFIPLDKGSLATDPGLPGSSLPTDSFRP
ncbi:glutamate 5-kinase [Bradyrhizobium sp. BRP14]|nr:glutamate 5-kinase [Bradyrhizobium sp. BRP14]